ncbi:MAG: prolipoprotein diacylglyceryl transferase [Proteobacteria bacterium]|nr:prolipoprotein diacylglyceryl transferase [Pseudomonadota bacterium]
MYPEIFRIGDLAIHTYGLFIVVGIFAGFFVIKRECERINLDFRHVSDVLFWAIWAGLLGSRIFYVIYFPEEFISNPIEIVKIWKGGLVFHGGIIFAVPISIYLLKKFKLPIIKTIDTTSIAIPLAHFFGRLGCFFAGCCYGKVCELPWAVTFKHPKSIAPVNIPLHPTQLYESLANLFLFIILLSTRKKTDKNGLKTGIYLIGYGIIRFIVELFRGDYRQIYFSLSSAQWISVFFILIGAIIVIKIALGGKR